MLPAKLALATAMLVAAPACYLFAGIGEPARAISDPSGLVFPANGAGGLSASAAAEQAQKPAVARKAAQPGTAQAAEAPARVVKVLVDSPFALPAGTVAIPAYNLAKPGPVPTPGSTLGSISPEPRRVAAAERAPSREARKAIQARQRAAMAEGRWKVAPGVEPELLDEGVSAYAEGFDAAPAPHPRRRAMPQVRYADRVGIPNPFSALFR